MSNETVYTPMHFCPVCGEYTDDPNHCGLTPEYRDLLVRMRSLVVARCASIRILERVNKTLADFYRAPLTMASVQPILDLAVELNPELRTANVEQRASDFFDPHAQSER